jgi:hypothetical protein
VPFETLNVLKVPFETLANVLKVPFRTGKPIGGLNDWRDSTRQRLEAPRKAK